MTAPVTHLGFLQDVKARCGSRGMSRRTDPAHVDCEKCLALVEVPRQEPLRRVPFELLLGPTFAEDVRHLAHMSGTTAEALLVTILEDRLVEIRGRVLRDAAGATS